MLWCRGRYVPSDLSDSYRCTFRASYGRGRRNASSWHRGNTFHAVLFVHGGKDTDIRRFIFTENMLCSSVYAVQGGKCSDAESFQM